MFICTVLAPVKPVKGKGLQLQSLFSWEKKKKRPENGTLTHWMHRVSSHLVKRIDHRDWLVSLELELTHGGLAQSEERDVSNVEAPGSKPGFSINFCFQCQSFSFFETKKKQYTSATGFEPARENPIDFKSIALTTRPYWQTNKSLQRGSNPWPLAY